MKTAPYESGYNKAGTEYKVTFRQPGCLSETLRLSAPPSRMVEYYRLPPTIALPLSFAEANRTATAPVKGAPLADVTSSCSGLKTKKSRVRISC